jgi:hypothetical protein
MHRPERWGYVQFSTARPGEAVYNVDPAGPIRDRLMQVYNAQKAFFEQNKRWAATLGELKLAETPASAQYMTTISLSPAGYEAAITFNPSKGKPMTLTIQQDSRIQSRQANSPESTSQSAPK